MITMNNQALDSSKKTKLPEQSIRPFTLRQLFNASQPTPESPFQLDHQDIHLAQVIGRIVQVQEVATHVMFTLNDHYATIEARWFLNPSEGEMDPYLRSMIDTCTENTWVRIIGPLKVFNQKRQLLAHSVRPLQHYNELLAHTLQVIAHHVESKQHSSSHSTSMMSGGGSSFFQQSPYHSQTNAKNPIPSMSYASSSSSSSTTSTTTTTLSSSMSMAPPSSSSYSSHPSYLGSTGPTSSMFPNSANPNYSTSKSNSMTTNTNTMTSTFVLDLGNPLYNAIMRVLVQPNIAAFNEGVHRQFLLQKVIESLRKDVSKQEFDFAIDWLLSEGHIFTTVDDDHFKCT